MKTKGNRNGGPSGPALPSEAGGKPASPRNTFRLATGAVLLGLALLGGGCAAGGGMAAPSGPVAGQAWRAPLTGDTAIGMVWIAPGTFVMGSPASETGRKPDEGPQTNVTLTHGYWLGKTDVTIGQWKALMGVGVRDQLIKTINDDTLYDLGGRKQTVREFMRFSPTNPDKDLANQDENLPMYFVSWNDAMAFGKKLTAQEQSAGRLPAGYAYTLPTEAQWEYACRAGTTTPTHAGPASAAVLDSIAWYGGNSAQGYTGKGFGTGAAMKGPRQVGVKQPNPWGLYDMAGNIWEWCRDYYGPGYPGGSVTDPTGPATGTGRVNRGGSFGSGAASERSAARASNPQAEASAYRGFRLALCAVQ